MNISEATKRACEEPTLLAALSFICLWESERVIKQAKRNEVDADGKGWDTCFEHCMKQVMNEYYPQPMLQTPMPNQYQFEVARDLIAVLDQMKNEEEVLITIKRHGSMYDWGTTIGETYNISELSQVIKKAYDKGQHITTHYIKEAVENFTFKGR